MKFKLHNESSESDLYSEDRYTVEEYLIETFYSLDEKELETYFEDLPDNGVCFITKFGSVIEGELHSDIVEHAFNNYCKEKLKGTEYFTEDDFAIDDLFAFNDHLVDDLGWVKYNSGTTGYDYRCYAVLPKHLNSKQLDILGKILNEDEPDEFLILTMTTSNGKKFDMSKYSIDDVISEIEKYSKTGIFEHLSISESVTDELYGYMKIFDTASSLVRFLKNKPGSYRILFDKNIDKYFLCKDSDGIHRDMLDDAYKSGYYYTMEEFIDQIGAFENYIDYGAGGEYIYDEHGNNGQEIEQYLYYFIFDSSKKEWEVGDDDYDTLYEFDFGNLLSRDSNLEDCKDLYNKLKN